MDKDQILEERDAEIAPAPVAAIPALPVETYWGYLEGLDLSDADKTALLHTLWAMMVGFVDLGFAADPVQHIVPALVRGVLNEEETDGEQQAASRFNGAADHNNAEGGSS